MTEINAQTYQEQLANHQLSGVRCQDCGQTFLPPRPMCPSCYSNKMAWTTFDGRGTLAAFTVVNIASTAMIDAGYGRKNPHCAGVVKLDEGPMVSAQILGVDTSQPDNIMIGTPVQAVFIERQNGEKTQTFLGFEVVV